VVDAVTRPLIVVNAPTLLDGAPELLHAAWVEWWLQQPSSRLLAEVVHRHTTADVVLTPGGAAWV
jgi:hypothetical protein